MKHQMTLTEFCEAYGMSATTVKQFASRNENRLPAYKIGYKWWVDVDAYVKWREREHKRSYKYA